MGTRRNWAVLLCMLIAACGDDDGSSGTPAAIDFGDPDDAEAFCEQREQAYCEAMQGCRFDCDVGDFPYEQFREQCDALANAVRSERVVFDPYVALTCLDEVAAASCAAGGGPNRAWNPPGCAAVFSGVIAAGEDCAISGECRGGYCMLSGRCPGECVAYRTLDQTCGDEDDMVGCAADLYCDEGRCKKRLQPGQPCVEAPNACATGSQCMQPADADDPQVCMTRGRVGDDCTTSTPCDFGLLCSPAGKCSDRAKAGEPCLQDANCPTGLRCFVATAEGPRVCGMPVAKGADCLETNGCVEGLYCALNDSETQRECVSLGDDGDSCTYVPCKEPLRCFDDTATCGPALAKGVTCQNDGQCESDVCRDDVCADPGDVDDSCRAYNSGTCAEGLYCEPNEDDPDRGVCAAQRDDGDDCSWQLQSGQTVCAGELRCLCSDDDCTEGKCTSGADVGEPCTQHQQCASNACVGPADEAKCVDRTGQSELILACVPSEGGVR